LDEPKDQFRGFHTGHHPAHLFRWDRRHHFGGEVETFAERNSGSQAPDHCGHARLKHRRCFEDDGRDRRLAAVAKGQQEVEQAHRPSRRTISR
jgi:hypothetical protein